MIIDSLSGEPLALRLAKTGGWKQITMLRAAARPGPMSVTFALGGIGEAAIDDVTVKIVRRGSPLGGRAQAGPSPGPSTR